MANLVRGRGWGTAKPVLGAQIDWGHPLSQGLTACHLFNQGAGNARELITGFPDGVPPGTWHDTYFSFSDTSSMLSHSLGLGLNPTNAPFTADALVRVQPNQAGHFVYLRYNAANSGFGMGIGTTDADNAGANFIALNEAVSWLLPSPSVTFTNSVWTHIAMRYTLDGVIRLFFNGREVFSATSFANGTPTAIAALEIGGTTNTTTRSVAADIATVRLWNRPLRHGEIQQLVEEPYAFIQPPAPKIFYLGFNAPAAGAVSLSGSAAIAVGARQLNGPNLTLPLTGKGAIAVGGRAYLTGTRQQLSGHGDIAVGAGAALIETLRFSGHADVAVGSGASPTLALALTGKSAVAVGARAGVTAALALTGHADVAVGTRGAVTLAVDLRGHADVAVGTGQPRFQLAIGLAGHGDVAVYGVATMTVTLGSTPAVVTVINKYAVGTRHMGLRSRGIRSHPND